MMTSGGGEGEGIIAMQAFVDGVIESSESSTTKGLAILADNDSERGTGLYRQARGKTR